MRYEVRAQETEQTPPPKVPLSRGKTPFFLDGNLLAIQVPLERKGFNVLVPRSGKRDEDLMAEDLPGRIFITNNPRDFLYSASQLDFSIIDTTHVSKDPQSLAEMIARSWVDYSLKGEHPAFYLVLQPNGRHELTTTL